MLNATLSEMTIGQSFNDALMLVEKIEIRETKRGKKFLSLQLRDESMSVPGVMWDQKDTAGVKAGMVAFVAGEVAEYNGGKQVKLCGIGPSTEDPSRFFKRTPFDIEEMWGELADMVGNFIEPLTKHVAEEILLKHAAVSEMLKVAPAATHVHNNWHGGLLEHVISLCRMAIPIVDHYQNRYCKNLSKDKVLFGLMCHDAGKIIEYEAKPPYSMTALGVLTNHMVLGPCWVYEACNKYDKKADVENFKMERAQLQHVLAAHHGKQEWGSPVTPATLEAILVHHLDNLDSKFMHAYDLIQGDEGPIPGMSQKSFFERTTFLKV
jgi:3'-5' exoribonuclease